jgi:hypothetical protein
MKSLILPGLAALAFSGLSSIAWAGDDGADRSAAFRLCRSEAAARANVAESEVRLDMIQTRARLVRVDLDVWKNGDLVNVRCDVSRDGELHITALNLPQVAQAAAH